MRWERATRILTGGGSKLPQGLLWVVDIKRGLPLRRCDEGLIGSFASLPFHRDPVLRVGRDARKGRLERGLAPGLIDLSVSRAVAALDLEQNDFLPPSRRLGVVVVVLVSCDRHVRSGRRLTDGSCS